MFYSHVCCPRVLHALKTHDNSSEFPTCVEYASECVCQPGVDAPGLGRGARVGGPWDSPRGRGGRELRGVCTCRHSVYIAASLLVCRLCVETGVCTVRWWNSFIHVFFCNFSHRLSSITRNSRVYSSVCGLGGGLRGVNGPTNYRKIVTPIHRI